MSRADGPETIAAIATALGGGIGIVRLSGPAAEAIIGKVVQPWPKRPQSHKLHLGTVRDPSTGETVDEVLACVMRAPRSYTGEDVGELHGHGGRLVMERVLRAVLAAGARMAQPGEFTRRAFEAGRIDLTRAEAVAELIGARSERALKAAQAIHSGVLEREIRALRGQLVGALAELEGALDFPDEELEARPEAETGRQLAALGERMRGLAGTYRRFVREGAEVALVGRVNAGKSSLFNALVGEERALVDAEAGTTRDVVDAQIELGGVAVRLVDTAGERFGVEGEAGSIERRGLDLARRRRGRADAVLLVVDGSVGFLDGERALWESLAGGARVVVWNKRDLSGAPAGVPAGATVVETAARDGVGIEALRRALSAALGGLDEESGTMVVSQRHHEALAEGAAALARAATVLIEGGPSELGAVEARHGLNQLGRVTGETVDADVLDAIFARFCIGK
jgi:tRNA modification GTPase